MDQINNPPPFVNDYGRALKTATVRWTLPGWLLGSAGNQVQTAGQISYIPIFVPERTTYDRIGINVQLGDGVGGLCDLRIYNWVGGLPGSQVLSAGTVSTNLAGAQEIVINQTLERGYYFLASRCDQAPTLRAALYSNLGMCPVAGIDTTNSAAGNALDRVIPYRSAAMADPAPAPTGTSYAELASIRLREA